jgi:hypothetical protein
LIREFRLSSPDSGRGVSCDANGAFVGGVSLLQKTATHGGDQWEPRNCEQISERLGSEFGLPIDVSSKMGGLKAICNALNDGDVARAQIATVLLGIPEPPDLVKSAHAQSDMVNFIRDLHWSGLIKADWDPNKHPRWPAGAPESQGGQFAAVWETLRAIFAEIGSAQVAESNANLAMDRAGSRAIADGLKEYANYRAKPWLEANGDPTPVSIYHNPTAEIGSHDQVRAVADMFRHDMFEPKAPLVRPATNADWIDPLIDAALVAPMVIRPILGVAGVGASLAGDTSLLAGDTPFFILRSELPADFETTLPIGKFEIPDNLIPGTKAYGDYVHDQIGKLIQREVPDVKLILKTAPNANGVDITVPDDAVLRLGFRYGEIKPLSPTGYSTFNDQVLNVWDLEGQVQAITYDYKGNIYYGFPGPWH